MTYDDFRTAKAIETNYNKLDNLKDMLEKFRSDSSMRLCMKICNYGDSKAVLSEVFCHEKSDVEDKSNNDMIDALLYAIVARQDDLNKQFDNL